MIILRGWAGIAKQQKFFLVSAATALVLASSISSAAGPDYFVSAYSDPWLATNTISIVYNATNLSDIPAPTTEIEFRAKISSDPSRQVLFGRVTLPNLGSWKSAAGHVTYPLPSWIPSTMLTMTLISHINPNATVPGENTSNNITTAGFGAIRNAGITSAARHHVPDIPRPGWLVPTLDPTFGSTIMRLTDPSMLAPDPNHPSLGLTVEYARLPVVNADGTKALLAVHGGADRGYYYLVKLAAGEPRVLTRVTPSGDPEFSWHPTNPNLAFYRFGNEVRVLHADTYQVETLMTFPAYKKITTKEEGRPSDDWRYFAFLGYRANAQGWCCDWTQADLVVADLVQQTIVAQISAIPSTHLPDWVGMSPSGAYVVAMFTDGQGTKLFRREDLSEIRTLFPGYSHSDFAIDANGDEVLVYAPSSSAQVTEFGNKTGLASVRLRDGDKKLFLETGWWWSSHLSGIGSRAHHGWLLVSTYNEVSAAQQPLGREIFWVALDGSGALKRIAHHHSDLAYADGGAKDYYSEPHATSSWDGTMVVFTSVWGDNFTQYDVYKASGPWWE